LYKKSKKTKIKNGEKKDMVGGCFFWLYQNNTHANLPGSSGARDL